MTLPAQWITVQANGKWDGGSVLSLEGPDVDKFLSPVEGRGSFAAAGRWNIAATVHHGVAYQFVVCDGGVPAAADPADNTTFTQMLTFVKFAS